MMIRTRMFLQLALALIVGGAGYPSAGNAQSPTSQSQMENATNKAMVRRWIDEGFNKKAFNVVDEIFAETFAINGRLINREQLKQGMRRRLVAFPDLEVTIDEFVAEGNLVGVWYTAKGTHRGEFEGIAPTGKKVTWFGFDLLQIRNGKVAQGRFIDDSLGLMRQLGASLSSPPPQGLRR